MGVTQAGGSRVALGPGVAAAILGGSEGRSRCFLFPCFVVFILYLSLSLLIMSFVHHSYLTLQLSPLLLSHGACCLSPCFSALA